MYTRGKFGIEYTPPEPKPEGAGLGRIAFAVALVIIALIARSIWVRVSSRPPTPPDAGVPIAAERPATVVDSPPPPAHTNEPIAVAPVANAGARPVKVRNLLLRLGEADRMQDVEMAISTIEQLRATPGAADLDDKLARKLSALNFRRLFERKSAQWTTVVKVKRGDLASRIAYEHGSTLASLAKLNGNAIDRIRVGQSLTVMNHPRFALVITRRTRTADLSLNGKFFKRYYLTGDVTGDDGSYATPERFRSFCAEKGVPFKPLDRAELEMLLPKGTAAFIKDI